MTAAPTVFVGVDGIVDGWDRGEIDSFGAPGRQVVRSTNWRTDPLTRLEHVHAAELDIADAVWRNGLILARSHIDAVAMRRCRTASSLVFEDCTIDRLDIRNLRGSVALNRCVVGQLVVHDVTRLSVSDLVATGIRISNVAEAVDVSDAHCTNLRVSAIAASAVVPVTMIDTWVRDLLDFDDLTDAPLTVRRVTAGAVVAHGLVAPTIVLDQVRADQVALREVGATGSDPCIITIGGYMRSLVLSAGTGSGQGVEAQLTEAEIQEDFTLIGPIVAHLESGRVGGIVRRDHNADPAIRLDTTPRFEVTAVDVPDMRIRNRADACTAARELLGDDGPAALATLRRSLEQRPREQDQVYFAQRCAESPEGWSHIIDAVQRRIFGYGVRLIDPVASLLAGIAATAVAVALITPRVPGGGHHSWPARSGRTLAFAAQLWFNVTVGLPGNAQGAGWALAAVMLTIFGVVLVTTLIGIGIRRLVR